MQNQKITRLETEIISNKRYIFKRVSFDYQGQDGETHRQTREVFDRGNGTCILLYNQETKNIILTRQFRLPTYLNANKTGMLIEVCAGSVEDEDPRECIIRETEEETGYRIKNPQKIFEAYMSPGAVTEIITFFVSPYSADMKVHQGGGLAEEHENIDVLELNFKDALKMIETGEIRDAKTIMLLQYAELKSLL